MSSIVVIVQLTALPSWLALTRAERQVVVDQQVGPALAAAPSVSVRWVDVESMTAACSDVMLVETTDLRAWNHLWERLRDSALFAEPYFRLEAILPGFEDGYLDYEATLADSDGGSDSDSDSDTDSASASATDTLAAARA